MRVLVTGAVGMLGADLVRLARARGHEVTALSRADLDVTDAGAVKAVFAAARPEVAINCAAYTNVDGAESAELVATAVNGEGAGNVARSAAAAGARLLHIGSDYVFPGTDPRPRVEDDVTSPASAYGRSKLAGDRAVAAVGGRYTVVRTAWLYGAGGKNFVDTIRRKAEAGEPLRVVDDQFGSPTWTVSLATGLLDLLAVEFTGTLHFANRGAVSWFDLARAIVEELGLVVPVSPQSTAELARPAPRPAYSALDTHRFEKLVGRPPLGWREALRLHLRGHGEEVETS